MSAAERMPIPGDEETARIESDASDPNEEAANGAPVDMTEDAHLTEGSVTDADVDALFDTLGSVESPDMPRKKDGRHPGDIGTESMLEEEMQELEQKKREKGLIDRIRESLGIKKHDDE